MWNTAWALSGLVANYRVLSLSLTPFLPPFWHVVFDLRWHLMMCWMCILSTGCYYDINITGKKKMEAETLAMIIPLNSSGDCKSVCVGVFDHNAGVKVYCTHIHVLVVLMGCHMNMYSIHVCPAVLWSNFWSVSMHADLICITTVWENS